MVQAARDAVSHEIQQQFGLASTKSKVRIRDPDASH